MKYLKVNLEYLSYVLKHKFFVFWAGLYILPPGWWQKTKFVFRLLVHDYSKFYPDEWTSYRDWFNDRPESDPEKSQAHDRFDYGWLKHIHRQDHHWQHWSQIRDATSVHEGSELIQPPIPDLAMREMVADWAGAGRAQHGEWEVEEWYLKNEEKMNVRETSKAQLRMYVREVSAALPTE